MCRYKQINLKFRINNADDEKILKWLSSTGNIAHAVRTLVLREIEKEEDIRKFKLCYGCMGATFGDCAECPVMRCYDENI